MALRVVQSRCLIPVVQINTSKWMTSKILRHYRGFPRQSVKDLQNWQRQRELMNEMGISLPDHPQNPDSIIQMEELENMKDIEDIYTNQTTEMQEMILKNEEREKKRIKMKIIERKFFKKPPEINVLSWAAKEQIKYLHLEDPEEWPVERLAEKFPISEEGVCKLLKSPWQPMCQKDIRTHDRRVQKVWKLLKEGGEPNGGPVAERYQQLLEESKLEFMENANGITSLPQPPPASLPETLQDRVKSYFAEKQVGPMASLVSDYCMLKDNLEGKNPNNITVGKLLYAPNKSAKNLLQSGDQQQVLDDVTTSLNKLKLKKLKQKYKRFDPSIKSLEDVEDLEKELSKQQRIRDDSCDKLLDPGLFSESVPSQKLQEKSGVQERSDPPSVEGTLRGRGPGRRWRQNIVTSDDDSIYSDLDPDVNLHMKQSSMETKVKCDSPTTSMEADPGLQGTLKITKGQPYTELLRTEEHKETDISEPKIPKRKGAYGYFESDSSESKLYSRNYGENAEVKKVMADIDYHQRVEGQPYYYDNQQNVYQHPYGKEDLDLKPLHKDNRRKAKHNGKSIGRESATMYRKGNAYYDESGEFLFKTPS